MLFVSDYDVITEPYRSLIITLQILLVIGCISICFLTFLKLKKKDPNIKKSYFLGIPLFFLLVGLARIFLIYHDYFAWDKLDSPLIFIANSIFLTGFIILNFFIETNVTKKTHYLFTILGIIFTVLHISFISPNKALSSLFFYFAVSSQVIAPLGVYLIVAKNGRGEVKLKATIIVLGLLVLILSQSTGIFELLGFMDRISSSIFAPPVALIGLTILGYGFTKGPN